jgi:Fic family protein
MKEKPKDLASLLADADSKYQPISKFDRFADYKIDSEAWQDSVKTLRRLTEAAPEVQHARALATVLRAAAIQTGAIEDLYTEVPAGVTFEIATEEEGWETELDSHDPQARTHFDAQLAAYDDLLHMARDDTPVTEAWIRELHRTVCAGQETYIAWTAVGPQRQPLRHGEYKSRPNHVIKRDGGIHSYCPVVDTRPEMHNFVEQLQSDGFQNAHALLQATYAHWGLTHVHPFSDGNGRVARALASYYLLRSHGVPLLIFADRKRPYFHALESADRGHPGALVRYFESRYLDTLAWMSELLSEMTRPSVTESVNRFAQLVAEQTGTKIGNIDDAAVRVHEALCQAIEQVATGEFGAFPGTISVDRRPSYRSSQLRRPSGYRAADFELTSDRDPHGYFENLSIAAALHVALPIDIRAEIGATICVASSPGSRFSCAIIPDDAALSPLYFRLEDISPTLSSAIEARLLTFARRYLGWVAQKMDREMRALLEEHGQIAPSHTPQARSHR